MRKGLAATAVVALIALFVGVAFAGSGGPDFGVFRDKTLAGLSRSEFGVGKPIPRSSDDQVTALAAQTDPHSLFDLAGGLHAHVVTTDGGPIVDQISLWPNAKHPDWLIVCNEGGATDPGLERINLDTGAATTIVTGTVSCDPTRRTPWGTIVFGEEAGTSGRLYELIDPVHTTGVTLDRTAGTFSGGTGASNLTALHALGRAAFEGLGILNNGTTYLDGDDSSQGPKNGGAGNSYYKFIPATPFTLGDPPITSLSQSPYAAGHLYGLRISGTGATGWGQGREFGTGRWITLPSMPDLDLESQTVAAGLTGYYRSEDADIDTAALKRGDVRVCSADTGDETAHLFGQVICITDGTLSQAYANTAVPEAQPFVFGGTSRGINMPDNVSFQPHTGNLVVHEDAETTFEFPHNNDLWDCLPDGKDQDLLSDGCIRIATLNDLTAEWTGGIFDASGKNFYVSIQHNISGKATVIDITGWDV